MAAAAVRDGADVGAEGFQNGLLGGPPRGDGGRIRAPVRRQFPGAEAARPEAVAVPFEQGGHAGHRAEIGPDAADRQ